MSQFKITSFFGTKDQRDPQSSTNRNVSLSRPKKRQKKGSTSSFGTCPLCSKSIPNHSLEVHASKCNGRADESDGASERSRTSLANGQKSVHGQSSAYLDFDDQPIEGLFVFENFITEAEEQGILAELDGKAFSETFLPWKASKFNGKHLGKRWGVHCNLRDRMVSEAENPLPTFMKQIIIPKLRLIRQMSGCIPNECNAIDYRRDDGHFLTAHVDDRQLSKEPIANLSLAGDCFMTFRNQTPQRNNAVASARVYCHSVVYK